MAYKFCVHFLTIIPVLSFLFLFLTSPAVTTSSNLPEFSPTDVILVNCGAASNSTSLDDREWIGDVGSKFISSLDSKDSTVVPNYLDHDLSTDPVPYNTGRVFHSPFTYTFHVSSGQKFVRLYFNRTPNQGCNVSKASFSVRIGHFILLSNFSPSLTSDHLRRPHFFVKEFCINVEENQALNITFSPTTKDACGFINGIEVLSMPTGLYDTSQGKEGIPFINQRNRFFLSSNTSLQVVHRLNVGGSSVLPINDSGLFRSWSDDTKFVSNFSTRIANGSTHINYRTTPAYSAPRQLYQSARSIGKRMNLTWKLPVDSGFKYLIRFHFCELQQTIKKSGDREFQIFINNQMAEKSADILSWTGGNGIPVFKDYIVMMPQSRLRNKSYLFLSLGPRAKALPILNGLELFKINNAMGNFGGQNAKPAAVASAPPKSQDHRLKTSSRTKINPIAITGATVLSGITVLSLVGFTIFQHCKRSGIVDEGNTIKPIPEGICRRFTAEEIRNGTDNFDNDLVIGDGGFGRVYKGCIDCENVAVAIKILKTTSSQGSREFLTEIEMLSKLRHPNLVSLIGYCSDERLMILVYDYMAHGNLRDHLYHKGNPPLPWKQRLQICIGAARGVHYLHSGAEQVIIHRDIKSSNILLDENWVPKVSDFGLSRLGPTSLSRSHVTTGVRGTFGYLDPDYFWTSHLTVKSDVYSFGVVLFEVLCARPAVDMGLEDEQHSLSEWARQHFKEGTLHDIIDPALRGEIAPECLKIYAKIAYNCLRDNTYERPTMSCVLRKLELALKLQESADASLEEGIALGDSQNIEQASLCGNGRRVAESPGDRDTLAVHSCPTFWQRKISLNREILRFFSEKARAKLARTAVLRALKAVFFAVSAYKSLPHDNWDLQDSNACQPDMS